MSWEPICQLADIPSNAGIAALVGEQQIAIFKVKDAIYAIDNHDPVSKANILSRGIVGCINGEISVASPLYKQHYSLQTGQCIEEDDISVKSFSLRCVDGVVEICKKSLEAQAA